MISSNVREPVVLCQERTISPGSVLQGLRNYITKATTPGYLLPAPTPRTVRIAGKIIKWTLFYQVGSVRVVGEENLNAVKPPFILTANHPHYIDAFLLSSFLKSPARCMAALGAMRFAGGIGALLLGPIGAFAANLDQDQGASALRAAVRVLTSNQTLLIFPEGWSWLDGVTRPFKKGVVRIAKIASKRMKQTVPIIPVFIRYGRYPGCWINRFHPALQYFIVFFSFFLYRRSVTVVIGNPVSREELPSDDTEATDHLRNQILTLDPRNNSW
jgi:1-acyl-sn-glycerol-3-phosphate acyltransferase